MKCRVCGFDEDRRRVYCRDCGARFYEIQDRVVLYHDRKTNIHQVDFSLHAINNGEHNLAISTEHLQLPGSYRTLITYKGPTGIHDFLPGSRSECQLTVLDARRVRKCQIGIPALIDNILQFIHELSLEVYPLPDIQVEVLPLETKLPTPTNQILLGPSRGYQTKIKFSLKNDSYAKITKITLNYGNPKHPPFPIILDRQGSSEEFELDFPASVNPSAFPADLEIQLVVECIDKPITEKFAIQYQPIYDKQDLILSHSSWTDEGLDVEAPFEIDSVINVPLNRTYQKEFSIGVEEEKDNTDAIQLLDLQSSLSNNVTISSSGKLPFFIPPTLTSQLTFRVLQQNVGGGFDLIADIKDHRTSTKRKKIPFPFQINTVQSEEYPYHIGIDFGTSNSCIALSMPTLGEDGSWKRPSSTILRRISPLPLDLKEEGFDAREIPSCLDLDSTAWYRAIGLPAQREERSIKQIKRHLLLDNAPGTNILPEEVATQIIKELIQRAMNHLDERGIPYSIFRKAFLTVPTAFLPPEVAKLRQACLNAFDDLDITDAKVETIDESLAALHYLLQSPMGETVKSDIIIPYDFGGGTTDVTAVLRESNGKQQKYTVIATGGDSKFGGTDINELLRKIYKECNGGDRDDNWFELLKRRLGDAESWEEYYENLDRNFFVRKLEELVEPKVKLILEDILQEVHEKLIGSTSSTEMSVEFILAGGSSNLYRFPELIKNVAMDLMQEYPFRLTNVKKLNPPKQGVSCGAFLAGTAKTYELVSKHNVTPYSVLWILPKGANPTDSLKRRKKCGTIFLDGDPYTFVEIIKRGTEFPCREEINIAELGYSEGQKNIPIEVYCRLGVSELSDRDRDDTSKTVDGNSVLTVILDENKSLSYLIN